MIIKGSISKIFDVYVSSPHITQITLKYETKLSKSLILIDKIIHIALNPHQTMTTLKESQYCASDHILQISKLVKNYFN